MKKEDIVEFFDKYIREFTVYKDDKLFQGISNYLVDYYYDDTYNNIPYELKTLYEDQELEPAVYDKFLIAIGVPQDVINKLSYREKIVFLQSLSDFRRYKGTIEFITKIGVSFNDTFNVYELYIDYNENDQEWCFKPVIIYNDNNLKVVQEKLTYEEVYDAIPSFLVPKEQLENRRINNQISLPIKSNILLLDQQIVDDISLINNLIISTFVKDYGNTYINVYFSEDQFSLDFKTIFYTWYYLASRYYGTSWNKLNPLLYVLQFEEYNNPYSIFDLKDIIAEYNELENTRDIHQFYEKTFGYFQQYLQSEDRDLDDMKLYLSNLDSSFAVYLENRIDESLDSKKEIDLVINDILNSLLYYRDSYVTSAAESTNDPFLEYFDYFLSSLPQLTINPEDTTSYTLIYNFKPYHTELLSTISNVLTSNDKFNSVVPVDENWFHFEMIKYEMLQMMDERYFDMSIFKSSDLNLRSIFNVNFDLNTIDDLEKQIGEPLRDMLLLEAIAFAVETQAGSAVNLSSFKKSVDIAKLAMSSLTFQSAYKIINDANLFHDYKLKEIIEENIKIPTQGDVYVLGENYTIT